MLTSIGHGKILERKSIVPPVVEEKIFKQNTNDLSGDELFKDSLIPPLLIFLVVPA